MKLSSQFDHDPAYTRFARQSGLRAADFEPRRRIGRRVALALAALTIAVGIFGITYALLLLSHFYRGGY